MCELASFDWSGLLEPPAVVFVTGLIIAVVAIVGNQWRKIHQVTVEGRLKRQMIERGYSAEEIERAIRASAYDDVDVNPLK